MHADRYHFITSISTYTTCTCLFPHGLHVACSTSFASCTMEKQTIFFDLFFPFFLFLRFVWQIYFAHLLRSRFFIYTVPQFLHYFYLQFTYTIFFSVLSIFFVFFFFFFFFVFLFHFVDQRQKEKENKQEKNQKKEETNDATCANPIHTRWKIHVSDIAFGFSSIPTVSSTTTTIATSSTTTTTTAYTVNGVSSLLFFCFCYAHRISI